MFVLRRDGSCTWQSGLGAAGQESVVTTGPTLQVALDRVNAFLDTPVVKAIGPEDAAARPTPGVDWIFWAKSAAIAGAVVFGFLWLTKV